jgi:hypothetical protein
MKFNKWTMGLAAVGVVSLASAARADEKMSQVQTALSNTTLSGYVDTSAMWQLGTQNGGPSPAYTPGGATGDGFNLDGVDVALDKPMDESPWASGYHVEFNMGGADAVGANGVRQAYLALRTPVGNSGIDWKIGTWDTIIGYESSSDPLNPNFTRSYGYGIEPTTHTGILGTYKINDEFTVQAGVANSGTGGNAINGGHLLGLHTTSTTMESQKAYLGSVAFTAPDSWGWAKGTTLNAGLIIADSGAAGTTAKGATWLYGGATVPTPMTALKVGAAFDYLDKHNGTGNAANPSDDSVWNVGLYANFQINDKANFNVRGEYLNDSGAGFYNGTLVPPGSTAVGNNNAEEFTATLSYQLWANVLSRVEFRWDHVEHGKAFDTTSVGPVSTAHDNAFLLALNLIYQF